MSNNATINTNLSLIATTQSISGKLVDASNSSIGLPGILGLAQTQDRSLGGLFFTDTNGNFTAGVNANQWRVDGDSASRALHGYLGLQNKTIVDTTTGSVSAVTIALPKATALFYGSVKDNLGNPLPGVVAIFASDNNNGNSLYQSDGYTDANGNYVTAVVGGLGSNDPWQVQVDNARSFPNYIFSQSALNQNGGTNLTSGKAVLQNFTAIPATNHITGHVQFNGNPVSGVGVSANATISGVNYGLNTVDADSNGNYSLNVANGTWSVNVSCCCDNDSLDNILGSGTYQCPDNQDVNIVDNNQVANFTVQACNGVQITAPSTLPGGQVGTYYSIQFQAASCNNSFTWSVNNPANLPPGLTLYSPGAFNGTPTASGTFTFSVHVRDGNGNSTDQSFSLSISGGTLRVTTTSLPTGTNGAFYSQQLNASGGTTPYSWFIPNYSADPPANLILGTNGVLSGTLATAGGPFYFDVAVTDGAASNAYQTLYIVNPPLPPLVITNVSLPSGTVGAPYSAQLGATGGEPPYTWSLAIGSASLPSGLSLNSAGRISGTPTTNKVSTFKVQATDANFTTTNKVLSITINPKPVLGSPFWLANQFQMRLSGVTGQNYTVQVSTNLSPTNWTLLFVTNSTTTNSFIVTDRNATNGQRFYRALVGP